MGELLLVCRPLAFLSHPSGDESMPEPSLLASQLTATGPSAAWTAAWLRQLHKGSAADGGANLSRLKTLFSSSDASSCPDEALPLGVAEAKPSKDDVDAVVACNAFGDRFDDVVVAAIRGSNPIGGHVGLWPHFSLFNHSCIPNAIHFTIGR